MAITTTTTTTTTTHSLRVPHGAGGGDDEIDEAQLLAETEELLMSLDPIAFVDAPDTQRSSASASTPSSSENSDSSNSTSGAQSTCQKIDIAPAISARKRVPKPGAVRNPSRERLQNELASLRKQVLVLESDLQNARVRQTESSEESKVAMVPMWECIAKRQLEACERSVSENKRLKSMIKLQKEMVVSLEEALYTWQHVATPNEPALLSSIDTTPHKNVHLEPGDELLFAMLVSELDATYLKVDEAFQEAGLHQKDLKPYTRNTPKMLVASDGSRRSVFEMVEVEFLPFDCETVRRVTSICSEKLSQSPDRLAYKCKDWDPKIVFTEKLRLKRTYNGAEISIDMLLALKDYDFEDQMVCVWRCIFKCDDQFPDAYVQEMGWIIGTNLATQTNIKNHLSGSLSKMCVHLEPKRFTAPSASIKAEADTMTNLVMSNYHDDLQEMNEMMERLLIQEGLQQQQQTLSKAPIAG